MNSADLDFVLPPDLVPGDPYCDRGRTRLLVLHADGTIEHRKFAELLDYIGRQPVWLNDSKVTTRGMDRGQTVYARYDGSLAVPSAGLDITEEMLGAMDAHYLTLHIGHSSFSEVRTETVAGHRLQPEPYWINDPPQKPVFCVGTTVVKALEAQALSGEAQGHTDLMIHPPFSFKRTSAILTHFAKPRNQHLALHMAFGGVDAVGEAYAQAVRERYRFATYGDSLLILR